MVQGDEEKFKNTTKTPKPNTHPQIKPYTSLFASGICHWNCLVILLSTFLRIEREKISAKHQMYLQVCLPFLIHLAIFETKNTSPYSGS